MLRYSLLYSIITVISTSCYTSQERLPFYNTPDFTPLWLTNEREISETITHRIADFSLTNQEGERITNDAVSGKIYVANFFFTSCPSICPKMTSHFEDVQEAFVDDDNVKLLSFSVTPWIDSVPRLQEYAKIHDVKSGKWNLLTGEKEKINALARQSYFAEEELGFAKDSTEFLHTENFILVDKRGRIRGIYKGTIALDTKNLIEDIKKLLTE